MDNMKDEEKTKEHLINELVELRQRIAELKKSEDEHKEAVEALHYRIRFQELITTLSSNLINLASDEIDHGINHALQKIGEFADGDRSYVFLFYDNVTKMDNTHEWCAEGIEPQIQNCQGFIVKDFPWCEQRIKRFETIHIPRVADLPPDAIEKAVFESQQIQSLILVPMVYGKSLYGFIGFDSVRTEKVWSKDIIALLRNIGEIFANALEHKRTEEALRESEEKYRLLFVAESDAIMVFDAETREFVDVNPAALYLYGFAREEFLKLKQTDITAEVEESEDSIHKTLAGEITKVPLRYHKKKDGTVFPVEISAGTFNWKNRKILVGIIRDITDRKRAEEALMESERDLRFLSCQLLKAQEKERRRLSIELHEELGQALMVLKLKLRSIREGLQTDQARLKADFDEMNDYIIEATENVRRLSRDLSPSILEHMGLPVAIRWLVDAFTKHTNIGCSLDMIEMENMFSQEVQIIIYRIIQECLTNITKHAQATCASIVIKEQDGQVFFRVEDNGKGINIREALRNDSRKKGLGLAAIHERIRMLGGSLDIWGQEGGGTRITFIVPLNDGGEQQ